MPFLRKLILLSYGYGPPAPAAGAFLCPGACKFCVKLYNEHIRRAFGPARQSRGLRV